MSVFRLQEWWQTQLSQSEEFDQGCMAIGNIDNAEPAADKIVIGSQDGVLRIFKPTSRQFKVEDLMLEESLEEPILQVLIGNFLPVDDHVGLFVLHPRKFTVYEILPQRNNDDRGTINFYKLYKSYEHSLGFEGKHFTAFNALCGKFGSERKDMIMVQSMDGKLQIFEQNTQAFVRQLSECLFPCPIIYVSQLDAFVVSNYSCQVECYRYQVLASAQKDIGSSVNASGESKDSRNTPTTSRMRGALVEWSVNLGEACVQLETGSFSGSELADKYPVEILVLCEHSVFLVKSSGTIIQQRKLDRKPSCMTAYKSTVKNLSNFIIGFHDCSVQVFQQFNLVWSAKASFIPVHLLLGSFGGSDGLITAIDESGRLAVSFLGTKPPMSAVVTHARELDYDKIDEEHRELMKIIKDSQLDKKTETNEKLLIRTQIARTFDNDYSGGTDLPPDLVKTRSFMQSSHISDSFQYVKISCRVYFSIADSRSDVDVSATLNLPSFVVAHPKSISISKLSCTRSTPYMIKLNLYARTSYLATGLTASISASFISPSSGEPRVVDHQFNIPLQLACRPKFATKNGLHKFTLETNLPPVPLTDLFDDFLRSYREIGCDTNEILGDTASKAIGFLFWSNDESKSANAADRSAVSDGTIVSIIASKTAGRYRIHSDFLPAIHVVAAELERRLLIEIARSNKESKQSSNGDFVVTCNDPFPLEEYFSVIDNHFSLRQNLSDIYSQLNDRAQQFRTIQKRLLVRYKDRNPSPLGALDVMLNETYATLLSLSDNAQELLKTMNYIRNHINALSNFIVLLLKLKYQISRSEQLLLQGLMCPESPETDEQGFEELVDVSMTYLLKTSLAKNAKESTTLSSSQLDLPADTESLKKHITLVIDRMSKGAKIS